MSLLFILLGSLALGYVAGRVDTRLRWWLAARREAFACTSWTYRAGTVGGGQHDCALVKGHKGPHRCRLGCDLTWTDAERGMAGAA